MASQRYQYPRAVDSSALFAISLFMNDYGEVNKTDLTLPVRGLSVNNELVC